MHGSQWFPLLVNGNPRKLKKIKIMRAVCDLPAIQSGPNPHKCDWIGFAILNAQTDLLFFQFFLDKIIRSVKV